MKKILFIALSLAFCGWVKSQDVVLSDATIAPDSAVIEDENTAQITIYHVMKDNVQVFADSSIHRLLQDKIAGTERQLIQVQGYRVQVFSSNHQQLAKSQAFDIEKQLNESGLAVPVYVQYNAPFWKVRLGNFRTQDEAQLLKAEIVRAFPELQADTYIVRDQIQVIN